jgi:hypothetical protein
MRNKLIGFFVALTAVYSTSLAQKPAVILSDKAGWHKIAETTADFKKDTVEIEIIGADKFAAIKFKIKDAAIDLQSLIVYYENDTVQKILLNFHIEPGRESRAVDLKGSEKALRRIALVYKTFPNKRQEKARVEIYGLKTNAKEK